MFETQENQKYECQECNDAWYEYEYHTGLSFFIEPWINVKLFVHVLKVVRDGFIEKFDVLSYFVWL